MKILVVEDEHRLADLLRRALEHERHTVDISYDGEDGLERTSTGGFDLIVLDVMLPKLDGFEVCRHLRAAGVSTPVLMLTARDAVSDRVKGLDAGADDYLTKPFAVAELLARVRALARRGPAAPELLQVSDVTLDPGRHSVRRGDKHVDLTRTEFALLEYLMRHPGQVLTRQQIMDHVWGYDYETMTNVVDIYVHYLRNKLERASGANSSGQSAAWATAFLTVADVQSHTPDPDPLVRGGSPWNRRGCRRRHLCRALSVSLLRN